MTQVLILAEGQLRFYADRSFHYAEHERTARVFVVDYRHGGGNLDKATVVFRESVTFEGQDLPAGAIREVTAAITDDEYPETFLTYDLEVAGVLA